MRAVRIQICGWGSKLAFRVAFTVPVQNPRMLAEAFRVPLLDVRMYAEVYGEFTVQGSGKILQS